jgi:hypothetical protein
MSLRLGASIYGETNVAVAACAAENINFSITPVLPQAALA